MRESIRYKVREESTDHDFLNHISIAATLSRRTYVTGRSPDIASASVNQCKDSLCQEGFGRCPEILHRGPAVWEAKSGGLYNDIRELSCEATTAKPQPQLQDEVMRMIFN
jgi:hypothetical protein